MKDFFKQELKVGDDVAFMCPNYRNMVSGVVVAFTPMKIRLAYNHHYDTGIVKHVALDGRKFNDMFLAEPCQVVKKP